MGFPTQLYKDITVFYIRIGHPQIIEIILTLNPEINLGTFPEHFRQKQKIQKWLSSFSRRDAWDNYLIPHSVPHHTSTHGSSLHLSISKILLGDIRIGIYMWMKILIFRRRGREGGRGRIAIEFGPQDGGGGGVVQRSTCLVGDVTVYCTDSMHGRHPPPITIPRNKAKAKAIHIYSLNVLNVQNWRFGLISAIYGWALTLAIRPYTHRPGPQPT